jgi:glycosyltransferase involved in cell wall biosynthesis
VPARNEAGHLRLLIESISAVNEIDKIVIVEGGSTDKTFEIATLIASQQPERIKCLKQSGKGKFNAVLEGINSQETQFSMIWDADGTVPVSASRRIIKKALDEECFSMGDRLRGRIEPGAMQFANKIGNWTFALFWAPIIKRRPTDIFCGTKVAPTKVFRHVLPEMINQDPYGDISLLLSARVLGVEINPVIVEYNSRVYGESKMQRWKMGIVFSKLTLMSYRVLLNSKFQRKNVPR